MKHQLKAEMLLKVVVYDKVSRMSGLGLKYFETGKITNFVTQDCQSIVVNFRFLITITTIPLMLVYATIVIYIKFSWVAFFLPLIFLTMIFLQIQGNKIMARANSRRLTTSDKRSKVVNEAISGIKNIKFNAWEDIILERTIKMRAIETLNSFRYLATRFFFNGFADIIPVILNLVLILVYTKYIGKLELSDTLTLIAYGNMLMMPTKRTVVALTANNSANVSYKRINKLLFTRISKGVKVEESDQVGELVLDNVTSGWTVSFTLRGREILTRIESRTCQATWG
jgi:ABC-type multidrug transport system fused ATPase/permease subunit